MDIYVKRFRPDASQRRINYVGRLVTVIGSAIAIVLTIAIDSIKGLNLFNVFQSVLGFIAPPMATVFLLGVFWKKASARGANLTLTAGTLFCLLVGVLYLWPPAWLTTLLTDAGIVMPHFMMLSFYLFVILMATMMVVSLCDKKSERHDIPRPIREDTGVFVKVVWVALVLVMVGLYIFFN